MKIFAISDLHGNIEGVDPSGCEVAVIAGDFAKLNSLGFWAVHKQVEWIHRRFIPWCQKFKDTMFFVIPGNHDIFADPKFSFEKPNICFPNNVRFLLDSSAEYKGIKFYGTPWIPRINGRWAFEVNGEDRLALRFGMIPKDTDILISHTPPYVKGHDCDKSFSWSEHFGSKALYDAVCKVRPKYHFFGHVHTGEHSPYVLVNEDGSATRGYNVSRLDEAYEVAYEPTIVEFEK